MSQDKKVINRILFSRAQIVAFGFALVIFTGTVLLMLPISSRTGEVTNFLDSLFTSTSATCVTGLVVVDTFTHWSLFGQIVILCLIQIGGLGVVTITAMLYMFTRKRMSINMRALIQESIFSSGMNGVVRMLRKIVVRVFIIEGVGAILLCIRFIPEMGILKGTYYGIFHSISAFCNAGFDIFGYKGEYSSLTSYMHDPLVLYTIMGLIVLGGLGFLVWDDIISKKFKFRKFALHTKIVLISTVVLIAGGTALYMLFERNYTFAGMSPHDTLMSGLFASISPRTAGMNSVDLAMMSQPSKMLTCFFMFIGGNSGSTAGGIKTTTLVIMTVYVFSHIFGISGVHIGKRRISEENVNQASLVLWLNILLVSLATLVISATQHVDIGNLMMEVFSAMGTVGLSTGLTRELVPVSQAVIILLMFIGRIGTVTFAVSFKVRKKNPLITYPVEHVNVG